MPSADQVPVISTHSLMLWPEWVVLIAGSTGSALRAVRPPNLHTTPDVRRDLVTLLLFSAKRLATKILNLTLPSAQGPVGIVTLKNRQAAPVTQLFISCIRDVARPLASKRKGTGAQRIVE